PGLLASQEIAEASRVPGIKVVGKRITDSMRAPTSVRMKSEVQERARGTGLWFIRVPDYLVVRWLGPRNSMRRQRDEQPACHNLHAGKSLKTRCPAPSPASIAVGGLTKSAT